MFPVGKSSNEEKETNNTVDLFQTLKNITVGADGGGSKIKDLIAENNEQGSLLLY